MRVLIACSYTLPHTGGLETLVEQEMSLLAARGHEVVIISSDCGPGKQRVASESRGNITIHRVPAWNISERRFEVPWPVFSPSILPLLWRETGKADAVHAHGYLYLSSLFALLIARLRGKHAVMTEHCGFTWYASALKRGLQHAAIQSVGRTCVLLANRIGGITPRIAESLQPFMRRGQILDIFPGPLQTELFTHASPEERARARAALNLPHEVKIVVQVGRIVQKKGYDLLLAAQDGSYALVFCGPCEDAVRQEIEKAGAIYLPPRPREQLRDVYAAADLLALPSRSESLPLVIQEALLTGTPTLVGRFADADAYRDCAGVYLCDLDVAALREGIAAALAGRAPTGRKPIRELFQTPEQWVETLEKQLTPQR